MACAAAGAAVAAGQLGMIHGLVPGGTAAALLACCGLVAIGYAAAAGRGTLMARVAVPSTVDSGLIGLILVAGGATAWIVDPAALTSRGASFALILLGLALQSLGGLLVIHEPADAPERRRLRLGAIGACLIAMGILACVRRPDPTSGSDVVRLSLAGAAAKESPANGR